MNLTTVIDCTGDNLASVHPQPGVLMAGYVTGSAGVMWTEAQFSAHPGAIRIDQAPVNTPADETADLFDVEPRAGTYADTPGWVHGAWTSYQTGRRPGQRKPTIYVERSEVTPVVNALNGAGITSGVNLFLTEPMAEHEAISLLNSTAGPFPFVGIQYLFSQLFDTSLVSTAWLDDVSKVPPVPAPKPGTQTGWRWCSKCQSLFFGPGVAASMCPRGGLHDGAHSHEYTLGYVQ